MNIEETNQIEDKKFKSSFIDGFTLLLLVVGIAMLIAFFLKIGQHYNLSDKDYKPDMSATGQIGDFIGGVVGTIFSLVGVFLLYSTLTDQREAFKRERFEQRLFELIKVHRENVTEFEIAQEIRGRSCFKYILNELRFIYRLVEVSALQEGISSSSKILSDKRDQLRMAYLIMFFGIGYSSERQLDELFNDEERLIFEKYVKSYLETVQSAYSSVASSYQSTHFLFELPIEGIQGKFTLETKFYPFDGHSSRLGHYFRLLFQIVKYIDEQKVDIITPDEKYEFAKNLRANLSNHEQLLLYYNSLSSLGDEWISKSNNLMKRYALIKNVPLGIVDIGVHPHEILGKFNDKGKFLFETDEILERKMNTND